MSVVTIEDLASRAWTAGKAAPAISANVRAHDDRHASLSCDQRRQGHRFPLSRRMPAGRRELAALRCTRTVERRGQAHSLLITRSSASRRRSTPTATAQGSGCLSRRPLRRPRRARKSARSERRAPRANSKHAPHRLSRSASIGSGSSSPIRPARCSWSRARSAPTRRRGCSGTCGYCLERWRGSSRQVGLLAARRSRGCALA